MACPACSTATWGARVPYATAKFVWVADGRIGLTYYLLILAAFVYVLGYSILHEQGYLEYEDILGTTDVLLLNPKHGFEGLARRPYCAETPCRLMDEHDIRYPNQDTPELLLTSMMTQCEQTNLCGGNSSLCKHQSPYSNPGCSEPSMSQTFFTAGLEAFSLQINHTATAPTFFARTQDPMFRATSMEMSGTVVKRSREGQLEIVRRLEAGEDNRFTVQQILEYAGLDLDAELKGSEATLRQAGALLFVYIRYTNTAEFWAPSRSISYEYEFQVPLSD
jgi:hypothetical protein